MSLSVGTHGITGGNSRNYWRELPAPVRDDNGQTLRGELPHWMGGFWVYYTHITVTGR